MTELCLNTIYTIQLYALLYKHACCVINSNSFTSLMSWFSARTPAAKLEIEKNIVPTISTGTDSFLWDASDESGSVWSLRWRPNVDLPWTLSSQGVREQFTRQTGPRVFWRRRKLKVIFERVGKNLHDFNAKITHNNTKNTSWKLFGDFTTYGIHAALPDSHGKHTSKHYSCSSFQSQKVWSL